MARVSGFILAQKAKLTGVNTAAKLDEIAVMEIDKATLPFARLVAKLEMPPPGQQASSNIPKAI